MENQMIVRIEKCLEKLKQKPVRIKQNGFLMNQFFMDVPIYKIKNDILNLRDESKEIYLSINLNQVYQVEICQSKMILFLDNDIQIEISI